LRIRALIAAVALAVGLPACDGGLTAREFARRADDICRAAKQRFERIEQPRSLEELDRFVDEAEAEMRNLISRLRELEPPEELAEQARRMTTAMEEATDRFDELKRAAAERDLEAIQELNEEINRQVAAADRAAERLGLEDCGGSAPGGNQAPGD
jgi:predicted nuclease with TOPRIM domain